MCAYWSVFISGYFESVCWFSMSKDVTDLRMWQSTMSSKNERFCVIISRRRNAEELTRLFAKTNRIKNFHFFLFRYFSVTGYLVSLHVCKILCVINLLIQSLGWTLTINDVMMWTVSYCVTVVVNIRLLCVMKTYVHSDDYTAGTWNDVAAGSVVNWATSLQRNNPRFAHITASTWLLNVIFTGAFVGLCVMDSWHIPLLARISVSNNYVKCYFTLVLMFRCSSFNTGCTRLKYAVGAAARFFVNWATSRNINNPRFAHITASAWLVNVIFTGSFVGLYVMDSWRIRLLARISVTITNNVSPLQC